jgi:hypothetical protein
MQYSKILTAMLVSPLPLIVAGCLTSPNQKTESIYEQSVRRAQIEQLKIDQQKKAEQQQIVQNNNRSQRVYVNQPQQPYPVNPPAPRNDVNRAQVNPLSPVQPSQQGGYNRRQDDLKRQATETAQLEQARQNSLATQASEEARRQERAAEEARQIEQATQESLRTHAEETARRQQAAAVASQPVVPQPVVQPEPVAVPAPEWEPNSGHLVRAGEFIMELKRSKGGISPSHTEMAQHIQANMGVSAGQAEKILEELGL